MLKLSDRNQSALLLCRTACVAASQLRRQGNTRGRSGIRYGANEESPMREIVENSEAGRQDRENFHNFANDRECRSVQLVAVDSRRSDSACCQARWRRRGHPRRGGGGHPGGGGGGGHPGGGGGPHFGGGGVARRTSTRHVLRLPTLRRRISALHVRISLHRIFRGPRSMRMRRRATSTVLISVTPISATLT